jgi:hypothetical protein
MPCGCSLGQQREKRAERLVSEARGLRQRRRVVAGLLHVVQNAQDGNDSLQGGASTVK